MKVNDMIYTNNENQWNKSAACFLTDDQCDGIINASHIASKIANITTMHPVMALKILMRDEQVLTDAYNNQCDIKTILPTIDTADNCTTDYKNEYDDMHGYIFSELLALLYFASNQQYTYQQLLDACDEYDIWLLLMERGRSMAMNETSQNARQIVSWIRYR